MRQLLGRIFVGLFLIVGGCSAPTNSTQRLPTITMQIGMKPFTLEVAQTTAEQEVGLMNRDSMPVDHGMLFVFADTDVRKFWMKNTRIPLDIVFAGENSRVVSIHSMQPFDLRTTSSDAPAKYAIELNINVATDAGVKVGDLLSIPALPPSPTTQSR